MGEVDAAQPAGDAGSGRLPRVPGYAAQRLIARGGQADVWLARDRAGGEHVVLKIGRTVRGTGSSGSVPVGVADEAVEAAEARTDVASARALAREIALLRRIDHPHVVRLRAVVDLPDGTRAMVLDHAAGGSLAQLVRERGRLDPGEVVTVLVALADTLADLHELAVVHGDVSPANVLLTAEGKPLLADLGAAHVLGGRPPHAWSTRGFADPAADGQHPAPAGDVFGLGAVAWFALTGAGPADAGPTDAGPTDAGPTDAGPAEPGPAQPEALGVGGVNAPQALLDLLRACLSRVPDERPSAREVARRAWDAVRPAPLRPASARAGLVGLDGDVTRQIRHDAADLSPEPPAEPALAGRGGRLGLGAALGRHAWLAAGCACAALVTSGVMYVVLERGPSMGGGAPRSAWGVRPSSPNPANTGLAQTPAPGAGKEVGLTATEAAALVQQVARARAAAFATGSIAPLVDVDEPGSASLAADASVLAAVVDDGVRLDGLVFRVGGVRVVASAGSTATLDAQVTMSAYRRVRRDGSVVERVAAGAPTWVRLVVVRAGRQWLVRSVVSS